MQKRVDQYQADFARLTAEEQAAVTTAIAGPALDAPSVADLPLAPGSAAAVAIETALAQVGDPYVWGATGPDGFDCSGLTSFAYGAAGVGLPHSSRAQSSMGRQLGADEPMQPGDLVFFYSPISHVGLYIGNGMMVHARTFGQPVAVTSVHQGGFRFGVAATRPPEARRLEGAQWMRRPSRSSSTAAAIRFARVAGVAAVCTRQRIA